MVLTHYLGSNRFLNQSVFDESLNILVFFILRYVFTRKSKQATGNIMSANFG